MDENLDQIKKSSSTSQETTSSSLVTKFLLAGFGLVFAFSLLEVGLRGYYFITSKQLFGLSPVRTTIKWQEDKILGRRLIPNTTGWFVPRTQEYFTWIQVNSHGWADVEHSYENPEDKQRLLFLGDSFVENAQVPLEKRFFRQFQTAFPATEVIALGQGNTGTAQQLIVLKNFALDYKPNIVVQMFLTANDVKNNSPELQNDPFLPYFKVSDDNTLKQVPNQLRSTRRWETVKSVLKKFRTTELLLAVRHRMITKQKAFEQGFPVDYGIYQEPYSQDYQKAWDLTKKLILESKKTSEESGAKYILVALANNEQVNSSVWEQTLQTYPQMKSKNFDLEKPDKLLIEFCNENEVTCFFMLPFFQEYISKNPDSTTHNKLDGHWNEVGTNLATEFLIKSLSDQIITQD